MTSELLAYAVGAHHGLFDCINPDGDSGFLHRLQKEDICSEEALNNFLSQCAKEAELDALFQASVHEITAFHQKCTYQIPTYESPKGVISS